MGKNNGIIIYDLDIYSNRISFFSDSRERIGSLFGLILTLINILASLIIFGVYLFEIFQRKDLKVYDSNKFSDNTPFININSSNLYFAFGLEDRNSSNRFVDPSIYYPEALFLERVKKEGGEFEFYNGSIKGTVKEIVDNKKLLLNWKFSNWSVPADIQMTFKEKAGNESQITILIKNCPNRDANNQTIERNGVINGFKQQIFEKIQMFMGYPLNKDDESSDED